MLRIGLYRWAFVMLAAAWVAVHPESARAFHPVIAVPAHLHTMARDGQPFIDFRAPQPLLLDRRTQPDDGVSNLKLFLAERSILDPEPIVATTLSLEESAAPPASPPRTETGSWATIRPVTKAAGFPIPDQPPPQSFILAVPPAPLESAPSDETRDKIAKAVGALLPAKEPIVVDRPPPAISKALAALQGQAPKDLPPIIESTPKKLPPAPPIGPVDLGGEESSDAGTTFLPRVSLVLMTQPSNLPTELPPMNPPPAPAAAPVAAAASPASCATCGRGHGLGRPIRRAHEGLFEDCPSCGAGRCVPGRQPCQPCETHDGPLGRLFCNFYECLCCPDPCYDPQWRQVANAAIFVEGARPVTQTDIRWNSSRGGVLPDRSEFIWARADGMGKGPRPPAGVIGPGQFAFDELVLITETAKDKLSAIVEMPYRAVDPQFYAHGSGFGDMAIGTKTLLFDCELLQVSMMMKTYLPLGNAFKGVGTGHLTLEPSLLFALKLSRDTYLQGQLSEWIPIGGDPGYAGSVLHSHVAINHVVYRFGPDIPLVGTFETNTFSFQDGSYTDPFRGAFQLSSGETYVSIGPGFRLMFCDKMDIGFGAAIAVTGDHFSREYYRTSVRFRF